MGARRHTELTGQALIRAVKHKKPAPGLIHHSDRGSQYCASSYQALVKQFQMRPSMSRKGNCYDNAPMESRREAESVISPLPYSLNKQHLNGQWLN